MKKILSFILAVIIVLSCVPMELFAEAAENITEIESDENFNPAEWIDDSYFHNESLTLMAATKSTNRYTVLTLDVSGSMGSIEMSKMKEASIEFCNTMLASRGTNMIAVVKFGSSASVACGFTDDLEVLKNTINGLSSGGGTDTAGGLRKVKELYDQLGSSLASEKNVMVFSDGAPNSESDAQNVFNSMKDEYNVYSLGYNLGSSGESFMRSIQNSGFYNVNSTDDIINAISDISSAILSGASGSINLFMPNTTSVTVYENKKRASAVYEDFRLSEGAEVEVNNQVYITDKSGIVSIPTITSGSITVRKDGYAEKTVLASTLNSTKAVYLQKDSGDSPVINAVTVDNKDILREEYPLDLTSGTQITLKADVQWKKGTYQSLYLSQSSRRVDFSGYELTTVISDNFNVGEDIYIFAIDSEGNVAKKKLNFNEDGSLPECLDGLSLGVGNKISATIPGDNPFFGGGKIGLDLPTHTLPIDVAVEDSKIYVTLGIDVVNYSHDKKTAGKNYKKTSSDVKWAFQNIKKDWSDAKKGISDLKKIKKKYKNALGSNKANFGFEADFTVIGFAEGYIDSNGEPMFTETGIILNPSIGYTMDGQTAIGPVPVYWEAYIKAEVEAQMKLLINKNIKQFTPNGTIEGTLTLGGGGGVGINKLASVGGGIEGSIKPHYEIYFDADNYFRLTAKYGAYFKAVLGFFEYKKKWDSRDYVWFDSDDKKASTVDLYSDNSFDIYNLDNYSIIGRGYANNESEFVANQIRIPLFSGLYLSNKTEEIFKTNVYPYTAPQLVRLDDGRMIAAWLDDDTARSDINRTSLYYSVYVDGNWSQPQAIDNDGTADFSPVLKVINGNAYIVWVDLNTVLDDSVDVASVWQNWEISSAEFSQEDNTFVNIQSVTSNSTLDMMPEIFGDSSGVYTVWVNSASNSVFSTETDNSILVSRLSEGKWTEPIKQVSGIYSPDSISGAVNNGEINIAYSVGSDSNYDDNTDKEIYLNGLKLTDNSTTDSNAVFSGNKLYWYSNGNICIYNINTGETGLLSVDGNITTDCFKVVACDNGSEIVAFEKYNGVKSELCAYFYDADANEWGEEVALTDFGENISGFSGVMDEDGSMRFILNKTHITENEDPYGQTNLSIYSITPSYNLAVEDVYYAEDELIAGNTVDFEAEITNYGEAAVKNYTLELLDENNNQLGIVNSNDVILPGQTQNVVLGYALEEDFIPKNVKIKVSIPDHNDINEEDNTYSLFLDYRNISVENVSYGFSVDGNGQINADIVNRGYGDGENIEVSLRRDSYDGEVVETKAISAVELLDCQNVVFETEINDREIYYVTVDVDDMMSADNYDYTIVEDSDYKIVDGGIIITNGKSYTDKNIVIPSEIDGYTVVGIGEDAYDGCSLAESITIPNTVTSIGDYAFAGCESLKEITIPSGVTSIGEGVFEDCRSLASIDVAKENQVYFADDGILYKKTDDGNELIRYPLAKTGELIVTEGISVIATRAFKGCVNLRNVTIQGLKSNFDGEYAFAGCESLESVIINDGLGIIGDGMFMNCISLASVKLSDSVTEVGANAFKNCSSLINLTIGENVKTIAQGALYGCTNLESVELPFAGGNENSNMYLGYVFGANSYSENSQYVPNKLKTVTLTSKYAVLGQNAFYNCSNITEAVINNLTVESKAFNNCSGLKNVTMTYKVQDINSPFYNCSSDIVIHGYTDTAAETFAANNNYTFDNLGEVPHDIYRSGNCGYDFTWELYYDHTLEISGIGAMPDYSNSNYSWYQYRDYIRRVEIFDGVTSIGTNAFQGYSGLNEIVLSDTIKTIKSNAFSGDTSLNTVILSKNLRDIGSNAFANCTALSDITLNDNIVSIGNNAFYGDTALYSINIPDSVISIGDSAFNSCIALSEVKLSNTLATIGDSAFAGCTAIESITIPYTVTSMQSNTFVNCLASMVIKGYSGSYAEDYANANNITFEAIGETIPDEIRARGVMSDDFTWELTYDGKLIINGVGNMPSYTNASSYGWYNYRNSVKTIIVNGASSIGANAFRGYSRLQTVITSSDLKKIEENAFYDCIALASVSLSDAVTAIGSNAFYNCAALTAIKIPAAVETIDSGAFYGCNRLIDVTIDENLKTIGSTAFGNCTALSCIEIPYTVSSISNDAFYNRIPTFKIRGYKDSYAEDYAYDNNITFEALDGEIPDAVRAEGKLNSDISWKLSYGGKLTISGVGDMPSYSGASGYGWYVYRNNIKYIIIENGINTIGDNAFNTYTKVRSVSLPISLKTIGANAFYNCKLLSSVEIPDSVTAIRSYAFYNCSGLTEVIMSNKITSIGECAFAECSMLPEMELLYTVDNISSNAFSNMAAFFKIRGYAGTYVENYCSSQKITFEAIDVDIPDIERTSGKFGDDFEWTLSYNGTLKIKGTGAMPSYSSASDYGWYNYRNYVTNTEIEEGVTSVGNYALYGYQYLKTVSMAESVKKIGSYAFANANKLTEVISSDRLTDIGSYAFSNCTSLIDIKLPYTLEKIENYAFDNCISLRVIEIPYTVTTMYSDTFRNRIADFVIRGYSSTYAEDYANKYGITFEAISNEVPEEIYAKGTAGSNLTWTLTYGGHLIICGLGSIPDYSSESATPWYKYRDAIRRITVDEGVTTVGSYAFGGLNNLTKIEVSGTVSKINAYAFRNNIKLNDITISDGVEEIGNYAFYGCSSLDNVVIPEGVNKIGDYVFGYCSTLSDVVLPNSLNYIGNYAFTNCTAIKCLTVPYSVVSISSNSFNGHITAFKIRGYSSTYAEEYANRYSIPFEAIDADVPDIVYRAGTFDNDFTWELTYDGELRINGKGAMPDSKSYPWQTYSSYIKRGVIGDGITSIGTNTFSGLTSLKTVSVASSVKTIKNNAFYKDSALTTVNMGNNITAIGNYAFYGCNGLEKIMLPDELQTIGSYAFSNCTRLNEVVIPDKAVAINDRAFEYCTALNNITIPYSVTSIGSNAFYNHTDDLSIKGYESSYAQDFAEAKNIKFEVIGGPSNEIRYSGAIGNEFTWRLTFGGELIIEGVGPMPDNSSYEWQSYGSSVKTLTIKEGVTSVGSNLCNGLNKLKTVNLPEGIKNIGIYAFNGCSTLKDISLPVSVINISSYAFNSCSGLDTIRFSGNVSTIGSNAFNGCNTLDAVFYEGSKNQWNNITINSNNSALTNAHIIYECEDIVYYGLNIRQFATSVTAEIYNVNGNACDVFVLAVYDSDGKLTDKNSYTIKDGDKGKLTLKASIAEGQTARAYIWDKNMKPYMQSIEHLYAEITGGYQDAVLETPHNYYNSMNETYIYTFDGEAESIDVKFTSDTITESGCDIVSIYDANDNLVGQYSGNALAGKTINIMGNTVKIVFKTDGSVVYYGFKTESIFVNA